MSAAARTSPGAKPRRSAPRRASSARPSSSSRSMNETLAPSAKAFSTIAAPMPRAPPVTKTCWPSRRPAKASLPIRRHRARADRTCALSPNARERRIGEALHADIDREQRAGLRLRLQFGLVEAASRAGDEQRRESRAAERAACDLRTGQFDDAIDPAVRRIARHLSAAPFGVPQAAVRVDGRAVRKTVVRRDLHENLAIGDFAAVVVVIEAPDHAGGRIGEIHPPAVRREGDRIGDADALEEDARRAAVIDPDPAERLGRLAFIHRAEDEPAATIELAVIEARRRLIGLDRGDLLARAVSEIEAGEAAGEAGEKARAAERRETGEPLRQRDGFGRAGRGIEGPKRLAVNVGPLDFAMSRRPD